jgi:hypothetical protein
MVLLNNSRLRAVPFNELINRVAVADLEHDEDPKLRPGPIEPEKRQDIILQMAAGIVGAYLYFKKH